VAAKRTVIVAGAGIAGLTAALALERAGFRVVVLEAAPHLDEIGAGIQLSPNAARVLRALGLDAALQPHVTPLERLRVMNGRSGSEIASMPLGSDAAARYGAPFWSIHRGDLQRVLIDAAGAAPAVVLRLGISVAGHRVDAQGVTAAGKAGQIMIQERGIALVGADGLWSAVRQSLGHKVAPRFRHRTAWRAIVPADAVAADWRQPVTTLWLGPDAHLVHYPVKGGRAVNIVAIVRDSAEIRGWSAPGSREALLARFARFAPAVQAMLEVPESWQTWSLFDLPPLPRWGAEAVTLAGDAAHPMLPFVAQGGALAIEDGWVLADELAKTPERPAAAFRAYEARRQPRTARAAREAARTGRIYHLKGPLAAARDLTMRLMGGARLQRRYDWLYDWTGA
jgi:2-polyprenyl-6-methoxyphenol hydroxylase-like FAD-dependent oxidoreductase